MRKKLTAVLPAAAMFAYALAGTTGIAQNVYAADEEETLTVWCWDPTFNVYAMKQAEAAYQKDHPNFKLDIQEKVYSDIEQSLITAAEAGTYDTLPDIFLMQDYSFHKNVTNYPEIFTELTDSGIDFSKFSAGKLADSTVDEKNYGVPFDNGATIMAIRSDMVEKAGLKVEDFMDTTWSEFIELAKKVVEANDVPMLTSSGGSEIVIEMLQSAGASPIVDGEVKLVDNEALKASYLPAAESDVYNETSDFYGGQAVYKDIVEFAGQVPGIDYGAYYSDIRSALTDAVTNVVQNDADIDEEIQNAQDTVEFNISE